MCLFWVNKIHLNNRNQRRFLKQDREKYDLLKPNTTRGAFLPICVLCYQLKVGNHSDLSTEKQTTHWQHYSSYKASLLFILSQTDKTISETIFALWEIPAFQNQKQPFSYGIKARRKKKKPKNQQPNNKQICEEKMRALKYCTWIALWFLCQGKESKCFHNAFILEWDLWML